MRRASLPLRLRLRPLVALVLAVCLLSALLVHDAPPAFAQTPGWTVTPSVLSVPVGSRVCYTIYPNTTPTHAYSITHNASGVSGKATVAAESVTQQEISGAHADNRRIGKVFCVTGVATGTGAITHSASSADTNYNGAIGTSVVVTVTTADSKSTIRFLQSTMRVVEGDTSGYVQSVTGSYDSRTDTTSGGLDFHVVKIKLDISPRPSNYGHIIWSIPHPDCGGYPGHPKINNCRWDYSGDAEYNNDYVAEGLLKRRVYYSPQSDDMEFEFIIRSDNFDENDERIRIYLRAQTFELNQGFRNNTAVCIGSCSSPTEFQQSLDVHILDDDGSDGVNCPWCSREGELGVLRNPNPDQQPQDLGQPEGESEQDSQTQQKDDDNTPNRAPTVAKAFSDVTVVNETGTEDVPLFFLKDDSPFLVFDDADGDDLTITASSSDEAVATAAVASRHTLTVSAKSRGTATITATADDGRGGTVSDAFEVTVKATPTVSSALPDIGLLMSGTTQDVSLSGVFSDADGDALSITAASSDDGVAAVTVASDGSALTLAGVFEGEATITVTAEDTDGNRVSDVFGVLEVKNYTALILQMYEWRNGPEAQTYGKSHTDRWDRALLAFGETVADASITPMTAAQAQALADRSWGTRWVSVAEALREIEAKKYRVLIAQMYEWRNGPEAQTYGKSHTDRWDRALLAFGETVADASITPMTAAQAQALADRSWGTRWVSVAEALREIEGS